MRYLTFGAILLALIALVAVNAGGGKEGLRVVQSILLVIGGVILMAVLFALFITRPEL